MRGFRSLNKVVQSMVSTVGAEKAAGLPAQWLADVHHLLGRLCAGLQAEGCCWLLDGMTMRSRKPYTSSSPGLNLESLPQGKVLVSYKLGPARVDFSASEMRVIIEYQRQAWTPNVQEWPMTAWARASTGAGEKGLTLCIPLHGPGNATSLVFIPTGSQVTNWYDTALGYVGALVATEQRLRMMAKSEPQPASDLATPLSEPEIKCLNWAAIGKTAWESAQIQNITERAVIHRLKRAREKLGVTSTAHAIAAATQLGLVTMAGITGRRAP